MWTQHGDRQIMELSALTKTDREYLEHLSDKIRIGEPVGFTEAILAIEYQHALKLQRLQNSKPVKLINWFNSKLKTARGCLGLRRK